MPFWLVSVLWLRTLLVYRALSSEKRRVENLFLAGKTAHLIRPRSRWCCRHQRERGQSRSQWPIDCCPLRPGWRPDETSSTTIADERNDHVPVLSVTEVVQVASACQVTSRQVGDESPKTDLLIPGVRAQTSRGVAPSFAPSRFFYLLSQNKHTQQAITAR